MPNKFKVKQRVKLTQPVVVNSGYDGKENIIPAGSMGTVRRHRNSDGPGPVWSYGVELDAVRDDPWNRGLMVICHHMKTPNGSYANVLDVCELAQAVEAVRV